MDRGVVVERQKALPLVYRGKTLDPVHIAQVLGYLRLSGCTVGLLINFNVKWLTRDGIKRLVNGFPG